MPTRIFIVPTATDLDAVEHITARLEGVTGVLKIDVTTDDGEVRVRYQKPAAESALIKVIEAAGYPVTQ